MRRGAAVFSLWLTVVRVSKAARDVSLSRFEVEKKKEEAIAGSLRIEGCSGFVQLHVRA